MRVIAGDLRGLRLKSLRGESLRPSSDRLRETLFDVLGKAIQGAALLDAYAGSGAVGIEALSRGAREVVFLESHRPAADLIRHNLKLVGVSVGFRLLTTEVWTGIERLEQEGEKFQVVFLDPPYAEIREYHRVLRALGRSSMLYPSSKVVAEHSRHTRLEQRYGSLGLVRLLRQGESQLAFYQHVIQPSPRGSGEGVPEVRRPAMGYSA